MQLGICQIAQGFGYDDVSDGQVFDEEIRCGIRADELGYDVVSMVEHHFEDYAFCPDNFVYLAHLAAKTRRIRLMTGAVIVPWNIQPLRVAEKAALLDELSGGRFILGLGRGLARREYVQMGIPMDESRERFDEAVPMILSALETGVMEAHDGKFFRQPRVPIRPRPTRSFKGRLTQVAMSGDSVLEAARHGAKMLQFAYKPIQQHKQEVDTYAAAFRKHHDTAPPVPYFVDFSLCDTNADRAAENAHRHIHRYLLSLLHHYEMLGDHFANARGYAEYGETAKVMQTAGMEAVAEHYLNVQIWGTPQQCLEKLEARRAVVGDHDQMLCVRYAGLPWEVVERSLETFARHVMPELKSWNIATTMAA